MGNRHGGESTGEACGAFQVRQPSLILFTYKHVDQANYNYQYSYEYVATVNDQRDHSTETFTLSPLKCSLENLIMNKVRTVSVDLNESNLRHADITSEVSR